MNFGTGRTWRLEIGRWRNWMPGPCVGPNVGTQQVAVRHVHESSPLSGHVGVIHSRVSPHAPKCQAAMLKHLDAIQARVGPTPTP